MDQAGPYIVEMGLDVLFRHGSVQLELQRIVVSLFNAYILPGNRSGVPLERILRCLGNGDIVTGKLGGPAVDHNGIQTHLKGVDHIVHVNGVTVFPLGIFADLDMPYLSFLISLLRLLFCQLRKILKAGPLCIGILAVKLKRGSGNHIAGHAHGVNMRIDGIHIRCHIVVENLRPGRFRRSRFSGLALSGASRSGCGHRFIGIPGILRFAAAPGKHTGCHSTCHHCC